MEKGAKRNKTATHEEYYNTFTQSVSGSNVLEDLKQAHCFYSSTVPDSGDPIQMAVREGGRNVILRIMTILKQYEEGIR